MPDIKEIAIMYLGFLLVINGLFIAVDRLGMLPEGTGLFASGQSGISAAIPAESEDVNAAIEGTTSYSQVGFTGDLLSDVAFAAGFFLNNIILLLQWIFLMFGAWVHVVDVIFTGFGLGAFAVIFYSVFGLLEVMAIIYLAIEFRRVVKL